MTKIEEIMVTDGKIFCDECGEVCNNNCKTVCKPEVEVCEECGGEGYVHESDSHSSDGIRRVCCENCNPENGYDEDAEYERWKDDQMDRERNQNE